MKKFIAFVAMIAISFATIGCGNDKDKDKDIKKSGDTKKAADDKKTNDK